MRRRGDSKTRFAWFGDDKRGMKTSKRDQEENGDLKSKKRKKKESKCEGKRGVNVRVKCKVRGYKC